MTTRVLREATRAYRIGDHHGRFSVWSTEGARQVAARWHDLGEKVIYASEHYSTALLEKLAYCNGVLPPHQHFVEVAIPEGVSYEVVTKDSLADWSHPSCASARAFGSKWYRESRSAILFVPSMVARMERNIIINAKHSDWGLKRIDVGLEEPVYWDQRLFVESS